MSNTTRTPQQAMADAIKSGAVQAWIDGNPIEQRWSDSETWMKGAGDVSFTNPDAIWRPAPTPRLRPWKPEEVPHLARIRRKSWLGLEYSTIVGIGEDCVEYTTGGGCDEVKFDGALEHFTYSLDGGKTWAPCGVQEGGE